jgi:transcriptional regulator with XRE-family HTH domain
MKLFDSEKFSCDLKLFRKSLKMSQNDLAALMETNRSTISNLERKKHFPSFELLDRFCSSHGVDPRDYFVTEQREPALYMDGKLKDSDKEQLEKAIGEIMVHEKYYELNKRCRL